MYNQVMPAIVLCTCAGSGHAAQHGLPPVYTAGDYLRNYALSACVATGHEAGTVVADAAAAASGYLELGSFPMEAYAEATLLAKAYLSRQYQSQSGSPLTLMKCIDLFHSGELAVTVQTPHRFQAVCGRNTLIHRSATHNSGWGSERLQLAALITKWSPRDE